MYRSPYANARTTEVIALYQRLEDLLNTVSHRQHITKLPRQHQYRCYVDDFADQLLMLREELLLRADHFDCTAEHFIYETNIALTYRIAS